MSRSLPPVVIDYFEAANRHDTAAMAACWRSGGEGSIPALGLTLVAPEALRDHFQELFTGVPDVTFDVREYAVSGGVAAVRSVMRGTHQGTYNGLAGTGRRSAVDVTDFIRCEDGLIVSNHVTVDALTTLRDLGVLPPVRSRRDAALRVSFNGLTRVRRFLGAR